MYGPRDDVDLEKLAALGLPFWLAGGYDTPAGLAAARAAGAAGIQVGTAFALCRESGIEPGIKQKLLRQARDGTLDVRNDPRASPAGFPFKVARLSGTVSEEQEYAGRSRLCDLGYLRTPYRRDNGGVGYRCPAEPVDAYTRKGGALEDTRDRRCLCNGLVATIGPGQRRSDGYEEPALVTLGKDTGFLPDLPGSGGGAYSAGDVLRYLLG